MPRQKKYPAQVSAVRRRAALARWAKLSPEERSQQRKAAAAKIPAAKRRRIAKIAAAARWRKSTDR